MPHITVLQVIPALDAGGSEQTALDIARALTARGDRSLIASEGGRLDSELASRGGELVRMEMGTKAPAKIIRHIGALSEIIRREKVDIVHARSRAPAWSAYYAAKRCQIPFVTTFHGTYGGRSALKKLYNSIMARGDVVIANSHFIARYIVGLYPWAADRIVTIPRGTDLSRFDPALVEPGRIAEMKAGWRVESNRRPIVLLPGRLTHWKGQLDFIEAFKVLHSRSTALPLGVIVGDHQGRTDYVEELKRAISASGLENDVLIRDHCTDIPAAMMAADIVVSASNEPEAFGRVSVEAQAMGRPVIATDHGGSTENLVEEESERTGWHVPPSDPVAMADRIQEVLTLPAEVKTAVGARAQTWAHTHYSVDVMAAATLQVYDDLMNRRRQDP